MHSIPKRFHFLDALRGLASLVLVCFHWRHFWITDTGAASTEPITSAWFPFYDSLLVFYEYGWVGVDLFFTLSGFIFYWKYSESIAKRETKPREFFILRFSRLYPLHALTLIAVAFLQYLIIQKSPNYFTYGYNDAYHFILNILFAAKWGLEEGFSFNGPIWSVSVEVLMYLLFFYVCLMGLVKKRYLFAIALIGGLLSLPSPYFPLGRGLWSFFLGGLTFYAYQWILEKEKFKVLLKIFLCVLPILCVLAVVEIKSNLVFWMVVNIYGVALNLFGNSELLGSLFVDPGFAAFSLRKMIFTGVLFPVMVITLALLDTRKGEWGSKISFIGNLSYSSYLLHFPLQIVFVLWLGNNAQLFSRPSVFLSYFFILIVLSLASFKYFERPVQNAIRRKFL